MFKLLSVSLFFVLNSLRAAPFEGNFDNLDLSKIVLVDIHTSRAGKVTAKITLNGATQIYDAAISSRENSTDSKRAVDTPTGIFQVHKVGISYEKEAVGDLVPTHKKEWLIYNEPETGGVYSLRAAQKGEVLGAKSTLMVTLLPEKVFAQISESYSENIPVIVRINEQQQD